MDALLLKMARKDFQLAVQDEAMAMTALYMVQTLLLIAHIAYKPRKQHHGLSTREYAMDNALLTI